MDSSYSRPATPKPICFRRILDGGTTIGKRIALTKKPQMPVPEVVAAEMTRIVRTAGELADLAQHVGDAYADLYDGAFRTPGNPDGYEKPISGGDFRVTDPTGQVATSGMHLRMRWHVRRAAGKLLWRRSCRQCGLPRPTIQELLEQAQDILVEAWAEQDPEFQEKLRRLRQLEKEIAGQAEPTRLSAPLSNELTRHS